MTYIVKPYQILVDDATGYNNTKKSAKTLDFRLSSRQITILDGFFDEICDLTS